MFQAKSKERGTKQRTRNETKNDERSTRNGEQPKAGKKNEVPETKWKIEVKGTSQGTRSKIYDRMHGRSILVLHTLSSFLIPSFVPSSFLRSWYFVPGTSFLVPYSWYDFSPAGIVITSTFSAGGKGHENLSE